VHRGAGVAYAPLSAKDGFAVLRATVPAVAWALEGAAMKLIPLNTRTAAVARRVVWFENPSDALQDPVRFMAYAMAHARHADMKLLRRYVSAEDFLEALDRAPPGIIDPRSWAYWNNVMGRYPAPPLPKRRLP